MPQEFLPNVQSELSEILNYWQKNTVDKKYRGFVGRIDHFGTKIPKANKGIILNARILWTFAAASNHFEDKRYRKECRRAYNYLRDYFKDASHGGVYWELDYSGQPTNRRKQVYAQAFTVYALAEYYKYCQHEDVLHWAMELFQLIETHALDHKLEGYTEAFTENWDTIDDVRLSTKEPNVPKTMNTHLHILEAYTTLYEIHSDAKVHHALERLIHLFLDKFSSDNYHFKLFFSDDWQSLSSEASYGHDIEAAWLLVHAAKTLKDEHLIGKTEALAISVADTFIKEALDTDYGVFNAMDMKTGVLDTDKHWWPQAEAVVGLLQVFKITGDNNYASIATKTWDFITDKIIDRQNGEWFFRVDREGSPYPSENKIGPWKCPYHNSRACFEVLKLLSDAES